MEEVAEPIQSVMSLKKRQAKELYLASKLAGDQPRFVAIGNQVGIDPKVVSGWCAEEHWINDSRKMLDKIERRRQAKLLKLLEQEDVRDDEKLNFAQELRTLAMGVARDSVTAKNKLTVPEQRALTEILKVVDEVETKIFVRKRSQITGTVGAVPVAGHVRGPRGPVK